MPVDLRSDTVTRPGPEMLRAMMAAEVGDNVLEHDPTVHRLEKRAAELTGKEAAIFVPSGTMGNLCALLTHTRPGDSVVVEDQSHVFWYEGGGLGRIAGLASRTLRSEAGVWDLSELQSALMERSHHTPGTSLVCLESSHNRHGGAVLPMGFIHQTVELVHEFGAPVHLDGARAFNATRSLGTSIDQMVEPFDSLTFCLSKGLGCPIGSVLCGPADFISEAEYHRKRLGGGLRQAGYLAAAGLYALDHLVDRLDDDHARAQDLAGWCAGLPGLQPLPCPTNILILETEAPSAEWQARLEAEGVRTVPFGPYRLRAVTHLDVDDEGLAEAKEAFARVSEAL
ncbi:MAG: aminotransferase class I/II-fold pyridoxal phosphate-dependent enzyme [Fimbriimonadaceae bacterium]|nr:aminotransferase class I/II-fold pyridoxal phosphate-dependent enzyme [Fimbriimonadaceae bacterium]